MSQRLDGVREANRGLGSLTPFILQKSRMRRRARTDLCGLRLETHEVQSPEMEAAAKPSSQLRTKSCVMSGDGHCEA